MGYTTVFEGQFDCYHPENKQLGAFLHAVRAGDVTALAVLGDWLSEQGDPRGAQIAALVANKGRDTSSFWMMFGMKPQHAAYLKQFSSVRRMRRDPKILEHFPDPIREAAGLPLGEEGEYFVGGTGHAGQDRDASVLDGNRPPAGQPGLWCKWVPNELGTAVVWSGGESFYDYVEWLEYLIAHFLTPWGYVLNGEMEWAGANTLDRGTIVVEENQVAVHPVSVIGDACVGTSLEGLSIEERLKGLSIEERLKGLSPEFLEAFAEKLMAAAALREKHDGT